MVITVAVDLDEVLGQFLNNLNLLYNEKFNTNWKLSDFFTYHFCEVRSKYFLQRIFAHVDHSPQCTFLFDDLTLTI